jgi:hypothetical protein
MNKRDESDKSYTFDPGLHMRDFWNTRFISSQGEVYPCSSSGTSNQYDSVSQRYVVQCNTAVSKEFKVEGSRFAAQIKTGSETHKINAIVKLSPPLRYSTAETQK